MRVFISWSSSESRAVAEVLRDWLPLVIHSIDPWVSSQDIPKGAQWTAELTRSLRDARFAILCVTPANAREPWINFEAGALSVAFESARVSPLLLNIKPTDLPATLSQFQCTTTEKSDVLRLVIAINACQAQEIAKERLLKLFELAWPELDTTLRGLIDNIGPLAKESANENGLLPVLLPGDWERRILAILAKDIEERLTAEELAAALGQEPTRVRYYLDKLADFGLIMVILNLVRPSRYVLSAQGRAYVVENGII